MPAVVTGPPATVALPVTKMLPAGRIASRGHEARPYRLWKPTAKPHKVPSLCGLLGRRRLTVDQLAFEHRERSQSPCVPKRHSPTEPLDRQMPASSQRLPKASAMQEES
jgi:hypothetical protein